MWAYYARREEMIRRAIVRAFRLDQDAKPVVLAAPGDFWQSNWRLAVFPEQQRVYLG